MEEDDSYKSYEDEPYDPEADYQAERTSIHRSRWSQWADDADFNGSYEDYGDLVGPDIDDDW